jgi:soluble lytic murein transglycosylase-like protein
VGALRTFGAALTLAATILAGAVQADAAQAGAVETSPGVEQWRPIAREAADRFGLPIEWVMRVIAAESGGRTRLGGEPITSHAGAMGLMQIMPATWGALRAQYRLGSDPHHPRDNIVAGTAYLRAMYDRFGYPGLFGAYNAGPGRYGEYVARGRPLPRETRDYMARVTGYAPAPDRSAAAPRAGRVAPPAGPGRTLDPIFFSRVEAQSGVMATPSDAIAARSPLPPRGGSAGAPEVPAESSDSLRTAGGGAIFAVRHPAPKVRE